jgi:hypothetical protein
MDGSNDDVHARGKGFGVRERGVRRGGGFGGGRARRGVDGARRGCCESDEPEERGDETDDEV